MKKICQIKELFVPWQRKGVNTPEFLWLTINKNITIMSEIEQKVKEIIVEKLGVDESEVSAEASFTNDLGADSLDTVELIMEFEKAFSVNIPDDKADTISTVGDAIAYIAANVEK